MWLIVWSFLPCNNLQLVLCPKEHHFKNYNWNHGPKHKCIALNNTNCRSILKIFSTETLLRIITRALSAKLQQIYTSQWYAFIFLFNFHQLFQAFIANFTVSDTQQVVALTTRQSGAEIWRHKNTIGCLLTNDLGWFWLMPSKQECLKMVINKYMDTGAQV